MPVEIVGLVCPQCGSINVEMQTDTLGQCSMCGAQFLVHTNNTPAANTVNDNGPEVQTYLIQPEYSKQEFLRRIWIDLYKADVPAEMFDKNFGEVETVYHSVVMQFADVEGSYTVSIGYDRQEPYIATETYWEREGDRNVKKERLITKYRAVTDWQAQNGITGTNCVNFVDNDLSKSFDPTLFKKSFLACKNESVHPVSESSAENVTPEAYDMLRTFHEVDLKAHLLHDLPGDRSKDLHVRLTKQNAKTTAVYLTQEYRASIQFDGIEYVKYGFPFGTMEIGGDEIKNENNMWSNVRKQRENVPKEVWRRTRLLSLLTIALLTLSIIVNLFIHITALTILCFVAGVVAFILNNIDENRKKTAVERETDTAVEQYQIQYRAWRLGLLNHKLASLGLAPLTDLMNLFDCRKSKSHPNNPFGSSLYHISHRYGAVPSRR